MPPACSRSRRDTLGNTLAQVPRRAPCRLSGRPSCAHETQPVLSRARPRRKRKGHRRLVYLEQHGAKAILLGCERLDAEPCSSFSARIEPTSFELSRPTERSTISKSRLRVRVPPSIWRTGFARQRIGSCLLYPQACAVNRTSDDELRFLISRPSEIWPLRTAHESSCPESDRGVTDASG